MQKEKKRSTFCPLTIQSEVALGLLLVNDDGLLVVHLRCAGDVALYKVEGKAESTVCGFTVVGQR